MKVGFETLSIHPNILKEILKFIIDNTQINLENSILKNLSDEDKDYVQQNYIISPTGTVKSENLIDEYELC